MCARRVSECLQLPCVCFVLQPLLDCYVQLRNRGGVVNMKLSETWLREQQVQHVTLDVVMLSVQ